VVVSTSFLDHELEIRKVQCSANAIESINARYRRAVIVKGHFPTEQPELRALTPLGSRR
jgi:putative transposase